MSKHSISFYTLGCRLNQSETAVVQRTFEVDGYRVVDIDEPADVVVINTCTVTENGDADTRRLVNKVNRVNPNTRIALIGCQAQIQKEKLTELSNVRWVVGNGKKMEILSIINESSSNAMPQVITPTISRDSFTVPIAGIDPKHTRANIKIQDGCDFFCSFCEIPYARGRARSRKFKDILLEAQALVAAGHRELIITGINIGTYEHNSRVLMDVIEAIEQIEGLERIRISSIEPTTIPMKLIEKMKRRTKLCRHLHIPLQSGNNRVLKAMKRKYSIQEFSDLIHRVHTSVPQACIGTDIIVGFPGETEKQFQETTHLLKELPLHYSHVFSYSPRHMAKSRNSPEALSKEIIQDRSRKLRELSMRKRRLFYESFIGTTQNVLFEQKKGQYWTGLTDNYARVSVKSYEHLSNQLLNVKCIDINGLNLSGSLCAKIL